MRANWVQLKEAIERILGVPVLTNGRADLSELSKDAQKREAKAAQKNQKTRALGNQDFYGYCQLPREIVYPTRFPFEPLGDLPLCRSLLAMR
jgi:hypothetical protein